MIKHFDKLTHYSPFDFNFIHLLAKFHVKSVLFYFRVTNIHPNILLDYDSSAVNR